jgi:hypothetical protein
MLLWQSVLELEFCDLRRFNQAVIHYSKLIVLKGKTS